jgi:hypothetical protein
VIVQKQVQAQTTQCGSKMAELGDNMNDLKHLLATLISTCGQTCRPPDSGKDPPPSPAYVRYINYIQ